LFLQEVNYHPQSGWLDFKTLKGGEKSKGTSVPVALPQGTTTRGNGFLEDNKDLTFGNYTLKIIVIYKQKRRKRNERMERKYFIC
jgi:hypothetical protein